MIFKLYVDPYRVIDNSSPSTVTIFIDMCLRNTFRNFNRYNYIRKTYHIQFNQFKMNRLYPSKSAVTFKKSGIHVG
jgi:hypothetical protein